jgi:hypothetical protein
MSTAAPSSPPARQLRLLATLAPVAGAVFALLAVWLVVGTVRDVGRLASTLEGSGEPVLPAVVLVLVGAVATVVTALIAHRLLAEVPRVLRGWEAALAERIRVLRGE